MKNYKFMTLVLSLALFAGCWNGMDDPVYKEEKPQAEGKGTFAYDITLPGGLVIAELTMESITQNGFSGKADLLGAGNNKGRFSMIPAGNYRVIFDFYHEDSTSAGKTEAVYIIKDQTTTLTADFSDVTFASPSNPAQSCQITQSGPVSLDKLSSNQVFAIAVNKAPTLVNYSNAGGVVSYTINGVKHQVAMAGRAAGADGFSAFDRDDSSAAQGDRIPVEYDTSRASEFNANPPPIPALSKDKAPRQAGTPAVVPSVGDKRLFWLDDTDASITWKQKQATLMAVSNHANIWILDEYFNNASSSSIDNRLTTAQAQAIALKFDSIYQYTRPVFGFEYGGEPNSPRYGGVDGDPKIQILIYDIGGNGKSGGTIGYFWSKDYYANDYLQSQGSAYKSNGAEIFYIDSYWADADPDTVYSSLIHEFVHMINFNEKFIKNNKNYSTWYTEMLAMLGEDLIGPLVGISSDNSGHPINMRIPYTLGLYTCDPFYWSGGKSYGVTFGFGAYLARNYGGADLIKEIARNDKTNIESISAALSVFDPAMTFTRTVERYYEAFIFNDPRDRGTASFNKTISSVIDGLRYTFYGFDIYQINRVNVALSPDYTSYWGTTEKGPFLYGLTQNYYMDYYSFILLSCADWQDVSGDMIVDMKKPNSSSVNMHLIVK